MKKRTTAKKAGAKKTSRKNTPKKTSRKNAKRARPAPKKKVITDRKATILKRLKNAFEDTATKIKTLLPGEPETTVKQPDEGNPDIKR